MNKDIKEEFEKAFEAEFGIPSVTGDHDILPALWSAQWALEKAIELTKNYPIERRTKIDLRCDITQDLTALKESLR